MSTTADAAAPPSRATARFLRSRALPGPARHPRLVSRFAAVSCAPPPTSGTSVEETPWPIIRRPRRSSSTASRRWASFTPPHRPDDADRQRELFWGDPASAMAIMGTSLRCPRSSARATPDRWASFIPQCFGPSTSRRSPRSASPSPRRVRRLHPQPPRSRRAKDDGFPRPEGLGHERRIANIHVVVATVDRALGSRGQAAFVSRPRRKPHPGTKVCKHGLRASHTADVFLDDVRSRSLPARGKESSTQARPPPLGRQLEVADRDADVRGDQAVVAAQAIGIARAAYDTRWSTPQRKQFRPRVTRTSRSRSRSRT